MKISPIANGLYIGFYSYQLFMQKYFPIILITTFNIQTFYNTAESKWDENNAT